MVRTALPRLCAAFVTLLAAVGCSEPAGLGSGSGSGEVTVTLQRAAPPSLSLTAAVDEGAVAAPEARVPVGIVASLEVTITDVQLLRRCDDADGDGEPEQDCEEAGWYPLALDDPVTVDLVALPGEDESPVVIASGDLPVGDYHNIRLFVRDETVVFSEAFSVGNSPFDPGTPYPVEIPSAANSGLKTDLTLTVVDDGEGNGEEVSLLFDSEATFRGVVATGSGKVMLPPVLKVRPQSD